MSSEINPYDIKRFIEDAKNISKGEIIILAQKEVIKVRRCSYFRKGAVKAREQGSLDYAELLKGLIAFLNSESRPMGISDSDFMLFRPLCEVLVQRKQLHPEIIKLFNNTA